MRTTSIEQAQGLAGLQHIGGALPLQLFEGKGSFVLSPILESASLEAAEGLQNKLLCNRSKTNAKKNDAFVTEGPTLLESRCLTYLRADSRTDFLMDSIT